jgi:hypothetical protein
MSTRLSKAAAGRLATAGTEAEPDMTAEEVLRVLARIARTGKPGDRLPRGGAAGPADGDVPQKAGDVHTLAELVLGAQRRLPEPAIDVTADRAGREQ